MSGVHSWRNTRPGADLTDGGYIAAYGLSKTTWQVLQQCKGNFSRANVMKQAANLRDLSNPVLLSGNASNTSPTNYHPIRATQLVSSDSKSRKLFGSVI